MYKINWNAQNISSYNLIIFHLYGAHESASAIANITIKLNSTGNHVGDLVAWDELNSSSFNPEFSESETQVTIF